MWKTQIFFKKFIIPFVLEDFKHWNLYVVYESFHNLNDVPLSWDSDPGVGIQDGQSMSASVDKNVETRLTALHGRTRAGWH